MPLSVVPVGCMASRSVPATNHVLAAVVGCQQCEGVLATGQFSQEVYDPAAAVGRIVPSRGTETLPQTSF